jgi:hypothetical protein
MREDFGKSVDGYAEHLVSILPSSRLQDEMDVIMNEYESFDEHGIWNVAVNTLSNCDQGRMGTNDEFVQLWSSVGHI